MASTIGNAIVDQMTAANTKKTYAQDVVERKDGVVIPVTPYGISDRDMADMAASMNVPAPEYELMADNGSAGLMQKNVNPMSLRNPDKSTVGGYVGSMLDGAWGYAKETALFVGDALGEMPQLKIDSNGTMRFEEVPQSAPRSSLGKIVYDEKATYGEKALGVLKGVGDGLNDLISGKPEAVGGLFAGIATGGLMGVGRAQTGASSTGPATSAANRVGLRESLAMDAGIPRNIAENPSGVWGSSLDDLKQSFVMDGATVTTKTPHASSSGNAQIFTVENSATGIKEVQFSPASDVSTHTGQYYKLTNTDGSKIKIVDPNSYAPSFKPNGMPLYDKNTVYLNPQGQQVVFNPATNTWVRK
ncbi:hypothetical protein CFter6_2898 [Collimonas fungivorans]|uniref:Uncharacterized protein n=1 Tax=Collimonas fungivorans TaxID=158899 RepID=A0A127PD59_9BURK|nr:hypothetical protein [Collimonas fungivorans]AMO95564.1 hypothetical protein CFter6_2898 [Collimonas fungivorans]